MNLQILKRETVDSGIKLPVYFHLEGELLEDTYIKITEEYQLKVVFEYQGVKIEKSAVRPVEQHWIEYNRTTEEHFNEMYEEALETFRSTCY